MEKIPCWVYGVGNIVSGSESVTRTHVRERRLGGLSHPHPYPYPSTHTTFTLYPYPYPSPTPFPPFPFHCHEVKSVFPFLAGRGAHTPTPPRAPCHPSRIPHTFPFTLTLLPSHPVSLGSNGVGVGSNQHPPRYTLIPFAFHPIPSYLLLIAASPATRVPHEKALKLRVFSAFSPFRSKRTKILLQRGLTP